MRFIEEDRGTRVYERADGTEYRNNAEIHTILQQVPGDTSLDSEVVASMRDVVTAYVVDHGWEPLGEPYVTLTEPAIVDVSIGGRVEWNEMRTLIAEQGYWPELPDE